MSEQANYVTCPEGHKIFVIWSDQRHTFGFTCDVCEQHSEVAVSAHGAIKIQLVNSPRRA